MQRILTPLLASSSRKIKFLQAYHWVPQPQGCQHISPPLHRFLLLLTLSTDASELGEHQSRFSFLPSQVPAHSNAERIQPFPGPVATSWFSFPTDPVKNKSLCFMIFRDCCANERPLKKMDLHVRSKDNYTFSCVLSRFSHIWLCNPMDCSPPGSSVHRILQAKILEQIAMPSSRGSSWPRDQTHIS